MSSSSLGSVSAWLSARAPFMVVGGHSQRRTWPEFSRKFTFSAIVLLLLCVLDADAGSFLEVRTFGSVSARGACSCVCLLPIAPLGTGVTRHLHLLAACGMTCFFLATVD